MADYVEIYEDYKDSSLKGKLKPVLCKSCSDNGLCRYGECEECLRNRAFNREYIETHTFITDPVFRTYHNGEHRNIKTIPLRLPNEKPYLYYGIELEVEFDTSRVHVGDGADEYESAEDTSSSIRYTLDEFTRITDGLFVYEHDGSLTNGVEFISRPCSYGFWTSEETVNKLKEGFEYLKSMGALAEQPTGNGMHIHISRKFFDNGNIKVSSRDIAYQGFDWLFQKFQPEFEKLGGRKYTKYCESKKDKLRKRIKDSLNLGYYAVDAKVKCTLKKGGNLPRDDHYSAINLGDKTLETRIFKSTIDYEDVLANIEIVRNVAHAVREEDINKSLDDILHTKDNLYLDKRIAKVRKELVKSGKKTKLNLDKVNDDKLDIEVSL